MRPTWDEFLTLADHYFGYLYEYGFKRTRVEPYVVEYAFEIWNVFIAWSGPRMELGMGIGWGNGGGGGGIRESLAKYEGKKIPDEVEWYGVETEEKLKAALEYYSKRLLDYGKSLLERSKEFRPDSIC